MEIEVTARSFGLWSSISESENFPVLLQVGLSSLLHGSNISNMDTVRLYATLTSFIYNRRHLLDRGSSFAVFALHFRKYNIILRTERCIVH